MENGPQTDWYRSLNKAPWSPEGWVFGVAWTTIMIMFSVFMAKIIELHPFLSLKLFGLYSVQWVLNVSWNYFFFNQKMIFIALIVIILLWLLIGYLTFKYFKKNKWLTVFIAPYLIWMTIATSLNAYIVFYN
jgi:tryptophan-rich sensory protein